jgi:hypothetical protein
LIVAVARCASKLLDGRLKAVALLSLFAIKLQAASAAPAANIMTLKNTYLAAYNLGCAAGWAYVLVILAKHQVCIYFWSLFAAQPS